MKPKVLLLLTFMFMVTWSTFAQRSIRIGYIDTEYILENIPEYQQASSQLDAKVEKWKTEIEQRLNDVQQKRDQLNSESVLLTKELIEERQEEIDVEESEILDYQQKRFGPNGDLMIQKQSLVQPIQDQIFSAVQEIAGAKQFDFVFDKSADMTMLFSAKRYDISEQVLRSINRTAKRTQAESRTERKAAEEEDIVPEVDLEKEAIDKEKADAQAARQKEIDDRKAQQLAERDAKRQEIEDKKKRILEERERARQEKLDARAQAEAEKSGKSVETVAAGTAAGTVTEVPAEKEGTEAVKKEDTKSEDSAKVEKTESGKKSDSTQEKATPPPKPMTDREKRQQALEEKKKRIQAQREKARQEQLEQKRKRDSIAEAKKKENDN